MYRINEPDILNQLSKLHANDVNAPLPLYGSIENNLLKNLLQQIGTQKLSEKTLEELFNVIEKETFSSFKLSQWIENFQIIVYSNASPKYLKRWFKIITNFVNHCITQKKLDGIMAAQQACIAAEAFARNSLLNLSNTADELTHEYKMGVCQCLISLGDIARYKSLHAEPEKLTTAALYYHSVLYLQAKKNYLIKLESISYVKARIVALEFNCFERWFDAQVRYFYQKRLHTRIEPLLEQLITIAALKRNQNDLDGATYCLNKLEDILIGKDLAFQNLLTCDKEKKNLVIFFTQLKKQLKPKIDEQLNKNSNKRNKLATLETNQSFQFIMEHEKLRKSLNLLRQHISNEISEAVKSKVHLRTPSLQTINENFTLELDNWLKSILRYCFDKLGTPPCPTQFYLHGSGGRKEFSLYSDLELMIIISYQDFMEVNLTDENFIRKYFESLTELLELYFIGLWETPGLIQNEYFIEGFRFDEGGNMPFKKDGFYLELSFTNNKPILKTNYLEPTSMLSKSLNAATVKIHSSLKVELVAAACHLDARLLLTCGNLKAKYSTLLSNTLQKQYNTFNLGAILALGFYKDFLQINQQESICLAEGTLLNVKQDLHRIPVYLIKMLHTYWGLDTATTNSCERVDTLTEKGYLVKPVADNLKQWINFVQSLRLRAHDFYEHANETILLSSSYKKGYYTLEKDEFFMFYKGCMSILIPIKLAAKKFIELAEANELNSETNPFTTLIKSPFRFIWAQTPFLRNLVETKLDTHFCGLYFSILWWIENPPINTICDIETWQTIDQILLVPLFNSLTIKESQYHFISKDPLREQFETLCAGYKEEINQEQSDDKLTTATSFSFYFNQLNKIFRIAGNNGTYYHNSFYRTLQRLKLNRLIQHYQQVLGPRQITLSERVEAKKAHSQAVNGLWLNQQINQQINFIRETENKLQILSENQLTAPYILKWISHLIRKQLEQRKIQKNNNKSQKALQSKTNDSKQHQISLVPIVTKPTPIDNINAQLDQKISNFNEKGKNGMRSINHLISFQNRIVNRIAKENERIQILSHQQRIQADQLKELMSFRYQGLYFSSPTSPSQLERKTISPKVQEQLDLEFRQACIDGKITEIKRLFNLGACLNQNRTPSVFHLATLNLQSEVLGILLEFWMKSRQLYVGHSLRSIWTDEERSLLDAADVWALSFDKAKNAANQRIESISDLYQFLNQILINTRQLDEIANKCIPNYWQSLSSKIKKLKNVWPSGLKNEVYLSGIGKNSSDVIELYYPTDGNYRIQIDKEKPLGCFRRGFLGWSKEKDYIRIRKAGKVQIAEIKISRDTGDQKFFEYKRLIPECQKYILINTLNVDKYFEKLSSIVKVYQAYRHLVIGERYDLSYDVSVINHPVEPYSNY